MKKILFENILHNILIELINEGRNAEKAKQNTYNVIKNYFNNASWLNDTFNDQAANPNGLSVLEYIENTFRTDFFGTNVSDSVIRLEPIMMNVALGLGFEQNEADGEKLNRLKSIIQYIKINNNKEGFPIQLNKLTIDNTSYEGLNKLFGEIIDSEIAKDNETANKYDNNSEMNPDYEVIEIHDMDEAYKYGKYSCRRSVLCFTNHSEMWDKFTNNGLNKVYLILNKNWRDIPEEFGDNNPYDEYGLSMIFLFINPEGNIAYSNTRWNHGTREHVSNVDNSFTKSDISKLLGINFNSVFKPYSDEELIDKGYMTIHKLRELLSKGQKLSNIFENIKQISDNLFLCKNNEDSFVLYNSKYNKVPEWINEWIDDVSNFSGGVAIIVVNGKYSLIDTNGNLIGDENVWFDDMFLMQNGFAPVMLHDKWSFISRDGKLIGEGNVWFDDVSYFKNGFAKVELNDKWSLINTKGELIHDGKAWFDLLFSIDNGFYIVELNGKHSFIDSKGQLIDNGEMWFDDVSSFTNGFAIVKKNDKYSLINTKVELIYDGNVWFDWLLSIDNGFYMVKLNDKLSLINSKGKLIYDGNAWFDFISKFIDGFSFVFSIEKEKWSFINKKGRLIGDGKIWFDKIGKPNGNLLEVELNGKKLYIDNDFNFYDIDTKQQIKNQLSNENSDKIGAILRECINIYLNRM